MKIKKIAVISVIVAVSVAFSVALVYGGYVFYNRNVKPLMGSPDCVIAADYSSMTLYGEKYVPFVVDEAVCNMYRILVREAQVVGTTIFDKLFFGDRIYTVRGCENNDIVFLATDYDLAPSEYYCRESKLDKYIDEYKNGLYNELKVELIDENWDYSYVEVSENLGSLIKNNDFRYRAVIDLYVTKGKDKINVSLWHENGIFNRESGEIVRYKGEYYYADNNAIGDVVWVNDNPGKVNAYVIDDGYDSELDALFADMFK